MVHQASSSSFLMIICEELSNALATMYAQLLGILKQINRETTVD